MSQDSDSTKEQRILNAMKMVLTDIIKDTTTAPGLKHPLSDGTIENIRNCLGLISARESELKQDAGYASEKPYFIDEPQKNVVVSVDSLKKKD
ncbi:MAG: segregation and condensation protein A [Gammaproteobacteria bacterium]|nr:segregation and condensation protein A [Gammaproteobacteria bacterium]MDH5799663.1 segregation and condensation protein A [Gammaproteobacteria bacterium]